MYILLWGRCYVNSAFFAHFWPKRQFFQFLAKIFYKSYQAKIVFDRCTDTNFQIQGLNSKKKTDDVDSTTSQG
jgi:hypothetical protein